jgi:hypothetical protein
MGPKEKFIYDVFVSYRWVNPDQEWVRNQLVPALQKAGLKVFLDVNDFVPGRDLILEMSRAGSQSHRALCVLSPDYFEGNRMVSFESLMSRRSDPSGQESRLIPLILRQSDLPEWLRGLISVDWTNPNDLIREWKKLLKVLEAPNLAAPPPAPIEQAATPKDPTPHPKPAVRFWPNRSLIRVNRPVAQWQIRAALLLLIASGTGGLLALLANRQVFPTEFANTLAKAEPKLLSAFSFATVGTLILLMIVTKLANNQLMLSLAQCFNLLSVLYLFCAVMPFLPVSLFRLHDFILLGLACAGLYFISGMFLYYIGRKSYGDALLELVIVGFYTLSAWRPLVETISSW